MSSRFEKEKNKSILIYRQNDCACRKPRQQKETTRPKKAAEKLQDTKSACKIISMNFFIQITICQKEKFEEWNFINDSIKNISGL